MPVFPVFLMGDVFPFPHVLWVFLRKKLFERFGCKEKRSTFVTAKAIHDRFTEDEGVFPTSGSGGSLTGRTAKRLLYSKSGEKTPIDFADSEKGFTFAPTVRCLIGSVP
ncbi:hypothetical protein HQ50_00650 [Porphyromonas sp. COT-052 OH4946]|uniref:hypothetical protein n=1 Tax=Porphyromonas sp. COT-052 OH4946 TaxID=1515618 RepID=UPI00051CC489|nr:hypothetical protein [Porphyromonas sp. COT-052 OH4946]KGL56848.1 hypothetical protein HQ50_00650 [Porphyromonas sp. COT-052 OH4946]